MRKIRIAQIGINRYSHGREVFFTLAAHREIFDIAGYALVEDERETCQNKLSSFEGFRELTLDEILSDPTIEAVTIETDEIHLTKYALMAAEHGKHIHMEKPGSPSLFDFERLVNLQKKSGRLLHFGYMYRYNPTISRLLERVKAGKLGSIFSVEAQMNCYHPPKVRSWLSAFPGGMMFFLGCHLVDLVLQIRGLPERVVPFNRSTGFDGVKAIDYGMAVLEYKNGVSFVKTCASEIGGYHRRQLVVSGSRETVEIKPLETRVAGDGYGQYSSERIYTDADDWFTAGYEVEGERHDRYENMMTSFASMVRGEMKNPYSYDYELNLFRTLLACCGIEENDI